MLTLEVLIGFDFSSVFQQRFMQLPRAAQMVKLSALELQIISLVMVVAPIPYHWIAGRGEQTEKLHGFAQRVIECALFPFALAMALDVTVASIHIVPRTISYVLGGAVLALALWYWYALGYLQREEHMAREHDEDGNIDLTDRIKEVLIETRVALPGVQATLGFQFIIVLATGFESLPQSLRVVHLASLMASAVCATLLIAPAAYHRVALRGQDSEKFPPFASRLLLAALVPLALALAGDVLVVGWKVTQSMRIALILAISSLTLMLGFWFGYMYLCRAAKKSADLQIAA